MENSFPSDKPNPFQGAYEPQHHPAASASTIRPFKAVDLGPAAPGPMAPGASPFLENYQGGFAPQPDFSPAPQRRDAPARPFPTPAQPAAELPRPQAPAAARASQIIATTDFPNPGPASAFGPRFFLSTTATIDGYGIESYLGIVSVEIVIPKDLLFRNPAPYGELHRLKSAEDQLQKVKEKAMEEISERAQQLQADGVVGMRMDFSSLDTVACLCSVSGTAVKLSG
jgi:uncharacterized protein YbjQ (UPF0145 family)